MKRLAAGVTVLMAVAALSGCAANSSKALADEKCTGVSERAASYSNAAVPDWEDDAAGESANDVSSIEVTQAATEVPEGGAYNVLGTATLKTSSGSSYDIIWRCFSQTSEGKTYADIVEWTRN